MAGLLGVAGALAQNAVGDDDYVVIVINDSGGATVHGINSSGQVAGEIVISGTTYAFVWLPETDYGLDAGVNILDYSFSGFVWARAFDINDDGQVVGGVKYNPGSGTECYPYVWDLSGSNSGPIAAPGRVAYDINDDANPLIVGGKYLDENLDCVAESETGFIYDLVGDDLDDLDEDESDKQPIAYAISNTDGMSNTRIAGASLPEPTFACGGFDECLSEVEGRYWDAPADAEVLKEIGIYSGTGETAGVIGYAVNDDLLVVGTGSDPNDLTGGPENECRRKALVWDDNGPDDAPTILPRLDENEQNPVDQNEAFDIRGTASSGPMEIVGWSRQFNQALIWGWNGSTWDLTNLDDAACTSGITFLRKATGINENGWICGDTASNNVGWVLIPKDEYTTACPADLANNNTIQCPDGVINLFDLLVLLNNWGTDDAGAAISDQGGGSDVVDLFDLLDLIDAWGNCIEGAIAEVNTIEDEVTGAGLTMDDWDDFMDVMTDPYEDDEVKENWSCWMKNTLSACPLCPPCPDENPFK